MVSSVTCQDSQNYLSNRKQRMVLNGSYSDYSSIESGVPQCSVLGPLLFLVYINDLERNVKSNIKLFADYTMLISILQNPETSANDLNHELDFIRHWAHQWNLGFNHNTTKLATAVLFSCKESAPNHPQVMELLWQKMNDQKHLGLILDSSISFKNILMKKSLRL